MDKNTGGNDPLEKSSEDSVERGLITEGKQCLRYCEVGPRVYSCKFLSGFFLSFFRSFVSFFLFFLSENSGKLDLYD